MSKAEKSNGKQTSEQATLTALASQPEMTVAEVAGIASLGRSTAGNVLARLADSGEVVRIRGGARRCPSPTGPLLAGSRHNGG